MGKSGRGSGLAWRSSKNRLGERAGADIEHDDLDQAPIFLAWPPFRTLGIIILTISRGVMRGAGVS